MKKLLLLFTIISHFAIGQSISTKYNSTTKKSYLQTTPVPKADVIEYSDTASGKSPYWKFLTGRIKFKNLSATTDTSAYPNVLVIGGDSLAKMSRSFFGGGGGSATIDTTKVGRIEQGRGTTPIFMYFNGTAWVRNDTSYASKTALQAYIPLSGSSNISGNLYFNASGRYIGRDGLSSIRFNDTQIYANVEDVDNQAYVSPSVGGGNGTVTLYTGDNSDPTRNRAITVQTGSNIVINGSTAKYDFDRTTEINAEPLSLINKAYADARYGASLSDTLPDGQIYIGDATNIAFPRTLSGDVTVDNLGETTIQPNSVDLTTDVTNILPNTNGGAGAIEGILKSDGAGLVSKAIYGIDYLPKLGRVANRVTVTNCGDSYTAGNNATTTSKRFVEIFSAVTNSVTQNVGVGGTGGTGAFRQHCQNIAVGNTKPVTLLIGLNDITRTQTAAGKIMIANAHRAIIAAQFLKTAVAANAGSVSTTGTWTTIAAGTYNDKASLSLSGLGRTSSVIGSTLTYTSTGNNLVIGTWGCDGSTFNDGGFTVTIDGLLKATYSPTSKAVYIAGVLDSGGRERFIGRSNDAVVINGLDNGTHTVVITTTSNNPTLIDYIGVMSPSSAQATIFVATLPKTNAACKAYFVTTFGSVFTDADFDEVDSLVNSVIDEFKSQNIVRVNTNKYINILTDIDTSEASNIHYNNLGHAALARSFTEQVDNNFDNYGATYRNPSGTTILGLYNDANNLARIYNTLSTQAVSGITGPNKMFIDNTGGDAVNVGSGSSTGSVNLYNNGGSLVLGSFSNSASVFRGNNAGTMANSFTNNGAGTCTVDAIITGNTVSSQVRSINNSGTSLVMVTYGSSFATSGIVGANISHLTSTSAQLYIGTTTAGNVGIKVGGNTASDVKLNILSNGNVGIGIGTTAPTSLLQMGAGTSTVSPFKKTAGVLLTTIAAGAEEMNASSQYTSTVALNRYAQGGKIFGTSTDVSNTSTTETDLITYTTKANTLVATDESLVFDISGTFNDVTATTQLQFYFGGTNIGNTGALTVSATGGWSARVIIIRSGASTAKAMVTVTTPGASTASYTSTTSMTGLTFSGTNIIKVTGTAGGAGGGTGDITGSAAQLMWWGASNN